MDKVLGKFGGKIDLLKEVVLQWPGKPALKVVGNDRVAKPDDQNSFANSSIKKGHLKATVANSLRMEGSTF